MAKSSKAIKEAMKSRVAGCKDPKTGEVNHTLLVEEVCQELDLYDDGEIPQYLFELATKYN